jgi:hypothetical protein
MDLPNILNGKGSAAAAAERQLQQQLAEAAHVHGGAYPDTAPDRGLPSHITDLSSKYPPRPGQPLHTIPNMAGAPRFTNSPHPQQPHAMLPTSYPSSQQPPQDHVYGNHQPQPQQPQLNVAANPQRPLDSHQQVKAFACSTCSKGFARRSDLARHGKKTLFPFSLRFRTRD